MSFRYLSPLLLLFVPWWGAAARELRVCADPNNLPFSNQAGEGLENKLAQLLAAGLKAELKYTWWVQRRSFLKNSLAAGLCDVVLGVPSTLDSVLATQPYYSSTYVFLERIDRHLNISSLNDPRLEQLRIGIHLVGNDYAPPAHLLARRGLSNRLVGYSLYGEFGVSNPPSRLIGAVVRGDIDVALLWGPFAGYFSKLQSVPLKITPVSPASFMSIPFRYEISVAVRKGDTELHDELEHVLTQACKTISALVAKYGIPQMQEDMARCDSSHAASLSQ